MIGSQAMKIDVRTIKTGQAAEIYITVMSTPQPQGHDEIEELFTAIAKTLRSSNAQDFSRKNFYHRAGT